MVLRRPREPGSPGDQPAEVSGLPGLLASLLSLAEQTYTPLHFTPTPSPAGQQRLEACRAKAAQTSGYLQRESSLLTTFWSETTLSS